MTDEEQPRLLISLFDAYSGAAQLTVCFDHYGIVRLKLGGDGGPIIGASQPGTYLPGRDYFEIGSKIDPAAGHAEIRINTVAIAGVASHRAEHPGHGQRSVEHAVAGEPDERPLRDGHR